MKAKSIIHTNYGFFGMCVFIILAMYGPFIHIEFSNFKNKVELSQLRTNTVIFELNSKVSHLTNIQKEAVCLAQNIYFEAGNQEQIGKEAIAAVTMNRVHDKRFPKTTCGVVYQTSNKGCQFSWTCDGKPDMIRNDRTFGESLKIAQEYLLGHSNPKLITKDVVWYHARYVSPEWAKQKKKVATLGAHIFYK